MTPVTLPTFRTRPRGRLTGVPLNSLSADPVLLAVTAQKVALRHCHRAISCPVPILAALEAPTGPRHWSTGRGRRVCCGGSRGMRGNNFHGTVGSRSWGRLTARLSRLRGLLRSKLDVQKAPHRLDKHILGPISRIQGHLLQTLERRGQGIHPLEALLGGRKVIDVLGNQGRRSRHTCFLQLVVFALEGCGELVNAALLSSGSR